MTVVIEEVLRQCCAMYVTWSIWFLVDYRDVIESVRRAPKKKDRSGGAETLEYLLGSEDRFRLAGGKQQDRLMHESRIALPGSPNT